MIKDTSKIGRRSRHPDNPYGQGSPDFWKAEYRLYGVSRQEYFRLWELQAEKCPHCGIAWGMAMGTGDCGCDVDPE